MNWFRSRRSSLAVGGGLLLPLAIAGLMVPFRASFAEAAAALVLIAVVALVATAGTRPAGYVASVCAAIWFDFFLTQPYERMAITQRPDIEITVSLLVVGVFITELAASNRHHHLVAAQESDFVRLIHDVSELASSDATMDALVERVTGELIGLLYLRGCEFEVGHAFERTWTLGHDGQIRLGALIWDAERFGLPARDGTLAVHRNGRTVGRFVLTPTQGESVTRHECLVAVALADQVGLLTPQLRSA